MPFVDRFVKANFLLMFTLYLKMARLRPKPRAKHEKNIDKRLSTRILCKSPRKGRRAFLTMLSNFRGRAEVINK